MAFPYESRYDPAELLNQSMWEGVIQFAMAEVFKNSNEDYCTVLRKPYTCTKVTGAFATGQLTIGCITRSLTFIHNDGLRAHKPPANLLVFRNLFEDKDGHEVFAVPKSDLKWGSGVVPTGSHRAMIQQNIPAFWACKELANAEKTNAVWATKTVHCKIGSCAFTLDVPIIKNSKPLKPDDEVIVLAAGTPCREPEEPPAKKHKGSGKGKAKPKAKPKAKGKAKAKARK